VSGAGELLGLVLLAFSACGIAILAADK